MALPATYRPLVERSAGVERFVRARAAGKFLCVRDRKLWVRGVTYGPFRPREDGSEYPAPPAVEADFDQMVRHGFNVVRTYTVPPGWLLDAAERRGLRVMVGLPWEQHLAFLDDPRRASDIIERVRAGVRACAGRPAVLCYAVGNEIPSSIVRWHGARRIERHIERLYRAAKDEDPASLVTYVNYPTTEYLQLPFLDLVCFNVFLESQEPFRAYLARLQNIAGDRPLVLTELGFDSLRYGAAAHEQTARQIRAAFAAGCAGVCVFAWTDEWHRGGYDIDGWAFGLTDRRRRPKPGTDAVRRALAEAPFPRDRPWPRVSVIVCTHNGSRTIRECLEGLRRLEYPSYEVIVVNDGSRDETARIVREYGAKTVNTGGVGLSAARNMGLRAATGEIVAYLDDDASPDPHWLHYLAAAFLDTDCAGAGGPNIPPPGRGTAADCFAGAPGGPTHVLLTDRLAEHVPGCNLAFRKRFLEAIGGFDPRFRVAGDDVDVCWRVQEAGGTLAFSPGAMVWHRRRGTLREYWQQQAGYGKAEALLERKWPERYNTAGHLTWLGRLYARSATHAFGWWRGRIYHGTWGLAPYQSLYQGRPHPLWCLPSTPEWYLIIAGLAGLAALGGLWAPLLPALPLLAVAAAALVAHAVLGATRSFSSHLPPSRLIRAKRCALMALLYLMQPAARLYGRLRHGLAPWRRYGARGAAFPWRLASAVWRERWRPPGAWLEALEEELKGQGACVLRGGEFAPWDLEVRGGALGAVRVCLAIEDHGGGRQQVWLRSHPRVSPVGAGEVVLLAALAAGAARDHVWGVAGVFGAVALALAARIVEDCATGAGAVLRVLTRLRTVEQ